ncbi:MAG TPA: hypothetical protein VLF59_01880 [Candidatus Saccharimonadales bacterium]|nr:hypothetical protein [Candidatus Saccharimonadales bacterium]
MTDIELAKQWITEKQQANRPADFEDTASDALDELIQEDPSRAFKIVHTIVQHADDEKVLASLGAGPLEDLINSDLAAQFIDDILEHARQDKNWRFALGCVWPSETKSKETYKKVTDAIKLYFPNGTP